MDISCAKENVLALVIEGYVNGYSIIKELYDSGVNNIGLLYNEKTMARGSNKLIVSRYFDKTPKGILAALKQLHEEYDYIVLYPTSDGELELLDEIKEHIQEYCYLPFNIDNLKFSLNRENQYKSCEKMGIPYPKTLYIKSIDELELVNSLDFPIIVKPALGSGTSNNSFRAIIIKDKEEIVYHWNNFANKLECGELLFSEYIEGGDDTLYYYTCFRGQDGIIYNEWLCKKLSQCPVKTGVFGTVSNSCPDVIKELTIPIIEDMNLYGIIDAEFKYDATTNQYKLMELTLRNAMIQALGWYSGVRLKENLYHYATGQEVKRYEQDCNRNIHLIFMAHELTNLVSVKGYWPIFKKNVFGAEKRYWAVYDPSDIKPFLRGMIVMIKMVVRAAQKRFFG